MAQCGVSPLISSISDIQSRQPNGCSLFQQESGLMAPIFDSHGGGNRVGRSSSKLAL